MQQGLEALDLQEVMNQREQQRLVRKAARQERLRANEKAGKRIHVHTHSYTYI